MYNMTHVERRQSRTGKETIHSGHFMVSHFEAEAQDDFDDLAVPVPDEEQNTPKVTVVTTYTVTGVPSLFPPSERVVNPQHQQLSIETSLTKLFKCMTLAYRQKLTSPKWNRFKGIKLRWKDKIRLNNVIWRCWHMQFIKKQNTLVCQFASPLDVDTHVKPEATILEGKYWKRRAEAVIAEYKKWRMFHIMRLFGKGDSSVQDTISDMDTVESISQCSDLAGNMLTDEDYLNFMSDTLFSTITNHQPFAFPDPREIARGASLADFIQPSLGPLQPNLDDYMDTLEPLQELLLSTPRLPPVPEESPLQPEESPLRPDQSPLQPDEMYRRYPHYGPPHASTATATPAANTHTQITMQGNINESPMLTPMSNESVKNEQMQMYESNRMYSEGHEMQSNMMSNHEYTTFEDHTPQNMYGNKARLQYVNTHKTHGILPQQESPYNKYNTSIPPSRCAPETVSLLQQPSHSKYPSTVVMQTRGGGGGGGGYSRDRPHRRLPQYPAPASPPAAPHDPYHGYPQTQWQTGYLQPAPPEQFKQKTQISNVQSRTFKMPSPPLVPAHTEVSSGASAQPDKQNYRSNSLPLGAQLNADWTISQTQAPDINASRHTARPRCSSPANSASGARRSRSGGAGAGGRGGPPPLCSVSSDPALPHATVMLAHLLTTHHSQSLYKLNSTTEEGVGSGETSSPVGKGQPSPIGSDVVSPHHGVGTGGSSPQSSPPGSPGGGAGGARGTHLHAEQKRRYNINNGFDTLHHLIPHLNNNPANKVSKAAMLQKAAEYIRQLKSERNQIKEEMESLRQQIERLNNSISNCHSLLPATGAPVSRARAGRLREMFARHVANRTMQNWKYWLFSVVAAALVDSFSSCVSCGSSADLVRTTLLWAEQHCSLVEMRPAVLNSLRVLCTTTEILTSPERLPEEARAAITHSAPPAPAPVPAPVKTEPS